MRRVTVFALLLFHFGRGSGLNADEAQKILTIASYNVENLWDHIPDNTPDVWLDFLDRLDDDERQGLPASIQYQDYDKLHSNWYDRGLISQKLKNIIKVLELAKYPDIVGLQEIESAGNTSHIFQLPYSDSLSFQDKLQEFGYQFFIIGTQQSDNPVAVTTAFISKVPLWEEPSVSVKLSAQPRNPSARDVQVVKTKLGGQEILLFNAHLMSRRKGGEGPRAYGASAIRARMDAERAKNPQVGLIVMGDLNAHLYEKPLAILGSTGEESEMLKPRTSAVYNLWFELKPEDRWEYDYDGQGDQLSHMLLSNTLYRQAGLQYVEQSFQVLGQTPPESGVLKGADGRPFGWQIFKDGARFQHIGQGYSDHLPLIAKFIVHADLYPESGEPQPVILQRPGRETPADRQSVLRFTKVPVCKETELVDGSDLDGKDAASYVGKCVKISVPAALPALALLSRGKLRQSYLQIPYKDESGVVKSWPLGLEMTRAFDWRPNIDDSRVTLEAASIAEGEYNARYPHPHSNRCFSTRVLQGKGGKVRKVIGRVGYNQGALSLFVASREKKHLVLEDLPASKASACRW